MSAILSWPILRDARGVYHRAAPCADPLAAPQDEVVTCGAKSDPHGEERGNAARLEPRGPWMCNRHRPTPVPDLIGDDRVIQKSEASVMESKGRSVLDTLVSRA